MRMKSQRKARCLGADEKERGREGGVNKEYALEIICSYLDVYMCVCLCVTVLLLHFANDTI